MPHTQNVNPEGTSLFPNINHELSNLLDRSCAPKQVLSLQATADT